MKKTTWIIAILVLALVVSNGYWVYMESTAPTWEQKLESSCMARLASAASSFSDWMEPPSDSAYYQGVSFFYAAWLDYSQLYPGTIPDLEVSKLSGLLMQEPEACQANMPQILEF